MAKVIWPKRAFNQLERNIKFLKEERGVSVAELVLDKILKSAANLESFQLEPLLLHKKNNYRYLVVWSYKIIYKVGTDRRVISRVFHTSRNPNNLKGV